MYENDRVLVFLCVYQCVCVLSESMDAWTEGGRVVPVNVNLLYVNEMSYETPLGGTPSSSTTEKTHRGWFIWVSSLVLGGSTHYITSF